MLGDLGGYLSSPSNRVKVLWLLGEHLVLALLPLLIGVVVAVLLGWLTQRVRWLRAAALGSATVIYTVPALALFVIMPAVLGTRILDRVNVLVALTLYTVALLLRPVVEALDALPGPVVAAATAMGYSPARRFVAVELTLGAAGEWPARWKNKIAQVYGCTFRQIIKTDAGGPVTVEKLRGGEVQVVNLFTTSPDIAANHWVELADPKHLYPAQRVLPLVRAGALSQAGVDALNRVSASLTTAQLTELGRRVTEDHAAPADLAKEFVNGLR